mgnify:CR=1 FL=1
MSHSWEVTTESAHQRRSGPDALLGRELTQLAVLYLLDSELGRSELVDRLAESGVSVDDQPLYRLLRRLESQGYLHSRSSASGGSPRRCYVITDKGRRARSASTECWRALRGALDTLVGAAGSPQALSIDASQLEAERTALVAERQEVDRLRSDLLSTVSHELRTPLTLIRTSVGLLLDSNPDAKMRQRLLRNIKQSSDRMHLLVTDILDLVRLRSKEAELQVRCLDVGELVTEAATLMRPLLDQKGQRLELEVPQPAPKLLGDRRRLEQVLLNLLSNANKFAPNGAGVRIRVRTEEQQVVIAVADDGPGIPPEAQESLFDRFYTAQTSSPSHNIGAGLGLPIAKGIVEAHGGHIWVESTVGAGSTFYVALPEEGSGTGGGDEDTGG